MTRPAINHSRRGFTLTELIVVIGITALLMTVLFIPLYRILELQSRGQALSTAQDNARSAMRRVTRDLSHAMVVYEPRPINLYGYKAWPASRKPNPDLAQGAEAYPLVNGCIAFRLPKQAFYDTENAHWVTPNDIDPTSSLATTQLDEVSVGTCPRHEGAPVELRPVMPMQPDEKITMYFVGLKDPSLRLGNVPRYANPLLFLNTKLPNSLFLNTYTLYRCEFDPSLPEFANWNVGGQPNANFFYDQQTVTGSDGTSKTFSQWWRSASRAVMNDETADVVEWVESAGKYVPHSLCTFTAGVVDQENAQPNRGVGQYQLGGVMQPGDLAPVEYATSHANWSAPVYADPQLPLADTIPTRSVINNTLTGPRIQIFEREAVDSQGNPTGAMRLVFDSGGPMSPQFPRERMVAYDPLSGRISLGINRQDGLNANPLLKQFFAIDQNVLNTTSLTADLSQDLATLPNGLPGSFGAAKTRFANTLLIVPGSEVVQLGTTVNGVLNTQPLRRAGWTGLGSSLDRFVAQGDLDPYEYAIDYRTGVLTFSDRDPSLWVTDVVNGTQQLFVKYQFQTNATRLQLVGQGANQALTATSTDLVRVSYATKELANVNLGVVQFTRKNSEALPFTLSERVAVRNFRK